MFRGRLSLVVGLLGILLFSAVALGCTDIVVGKKASADGSVITTHTCDCEYDSRLIVVPAQDFPPGTMAPVYEGIIEAHKQPLVKLGEIPQVPHTYKYFNIGYPFANEHQVFIGETTIGGNPRTQNSERAIMTIEQLEVFALQRAKTAREAIKIMGELAEKYGFRESCYLGEALTVTDPNEAWVFEVFGTGPLWTPESGKPGAVWAAQRVPDDHITCVPNVSRIGEIDPSDTENFMVCENYITTAVELGLYDPNAGKPFIWRNVYGDAEHMSTGSAVRLWRVFSTFAPSHDWKLEDAPNYPFSVKAEKPVSVSDVIAMLRDTYKGTPYDMTEQDPWYCNDPKLGRIKSPLATPQIDPTWRAWLGITYYRPIARYYCSYFFVSQARSWLPNDLGVLWFGLDNPENSPFIPVFVGINDVPESWKHLDRTKVDRDSSWWAFALVDDLTNQYYGYLKVQLDKVLYPFQEEIFAVQPAIEQVALELYKTDPSLARTFLTNYTSSVMIRAEKLYWGLVDKLLYELNNNRPDCGGYLYEKYLELLEKGDVECTICDEK